MDVVLIVDNQFASLERAVGDLVDGLPSWLSSHICKIGEKRDDVPNFLAKDVRLDDVRMIVVHASGLGENAEEKVEHIAHLYNGKDGTLMLEETGVPIIVTSNGDMSKFKHLHVLTWGRARWVQNANAAQSIEDLVKRTKEEYEGLANIFDLHQIYRTIFIVKSLCEKGEYIRPVGEFPLLMLDEDVDKRLRRVAKDRYSQVKELARACFVIGSKSQDIGKVIAIVNQANTTLNIEDIPEDRRRAASEALDHLLIQLGELTSQLNVGRM